MPFGFHPARRFPVRSLQGVIITRQFNVGHARHPFKFGQALTWHRTRHLTKREQPAGNRQSGRLQACHDFGHALPMAFGQADDDRNRR